MSGSRILSNWLRLVHIARAMALLLIRVLSISCSSCQAFPLELKVPNAETRAAMAEIDEMVNTRAARFASVDELFAELEEASDR